MNDNLNVERNKRLLMRLANLNQKYKSNTITSEDFTETGATYSMNVVANNILGTNISSKMKVVDYKIDMDGRLVIIGDGGDVVVTEFYIGSGFDDNVWDIIKTSDDKYLAGGSFTTYSGESTKYLVKLTSGGTIDTSFNSGNGFDNYVSSIQQTTDGGYLIGGYFTTYSGQSANYIIKLKSGGTIDTSFNSGSGFDGYVSSIQQTTDGGYLIGGNFTTYSGQSANHIIKLTSGGTIDTSFNSGNGFGSYVYSIQQTTDGGYLIGGEFTTYSGQSANHIIKLTSDGTIDTSFNSGSGFDGVVYSLYETTDGGYLIGGGFTTYSGQSANYIVKLTSDGTIDTSFNSGSGFDNTVIEIIKTTDGGYLIGGGFTTYSGQSANYIVKLTSDGTIDTSFNSGSGFDGYVYSIYETTDGGYLIGGNFTSYSGVISNYIIKLKPDGTNITISE